MLSDLTHKAFGIHLLTFMVTFTVMASGITSASTASRAFAENLLKGFGVASSPVAVTLLSIVFILLVMVINLWGVGHGVTTNVVLTLVEMSGLLLVVLVGGYAVSQGRADFSQIAVFRTPQDKSVFLALSTATSMAFFAMVGFDQDIYKERNNHSQKPRRKSERNRPLILEHISQKCSDHE